METLDICPLWKTLANFFPVLGIVLLNEGTQKLVLLLCPACLLTPLAILVLFWFVFGRRGRRGRCGHWCDGRSGRGRGGGGGRGRRRRRRRRSERDRTDAISLWCQWTSRLVLSVGRGLAKQTSSNDVICHGC